MAGRQRGWCPGRAAGVALLLLVSVEVASGQDAATCDRLPAFAIEDRFVADDVHRQAIGLIAEEFSEERRSRAQALLPRLQRSAEEVGRQHGRSGLVSVIVADWARVARIADEARYGEGARKILRQSFEDLLALAASPAEADYLVDMAQTEARGIGEKMAAISRHRLILGDQPRQISLLSDFAGALQDAGETLSVARLMREIAAGAGTERARYEADGAFLRAVAAGASDPSAQALATALMPIARARLERSLAAVEAGGMGVDDTDCWATDEIVAAANAIMRDQLSRPELEAAYVTEAYEVVMFAELRTDFVGASIPYAKLASLRAIDETTYRDLMRALARLYEGQGVLREARDEVGMALSAADVFASMLMPSVAKMFLDDAQRWSSPGAAITAEARFEVLRELMDFEWQSGTAARLRSLVLEADELAKQATRMGPADLASYSLFRARYEDLKLNDDGATEMIARSVEHLSLVEDTMGLKFAPVQQAYLEHLRGQFCDGCGVAMRPAFESFWSRWTSDLAGMIANPATAEFLITVMTSGSELVTDEVRTSADAAVDTAVLFGGLGTVADVDRHLVRRGVKAADRKKIVLLAAQGGDVDVNAAADPKPMIDMIIERNLQKKRRMADALVDSGAMHMAEFGADNAYFDNLDSFARSADRAGYGMTGRVIFESMKRLALEGSKDQLPALTDDARLQLAKVLAPMHARLARYALEDKNWRVVDDEIDRSMSLMRTRLGNDWQAGSEQAALLLNAFRPAMRLAAQLRFLLAVSPEGAKNVPGAAGKAFEDMQFAMLGETALAMQAAVRGRLTADPELSTAINLRDDSRSRVAQLDSLEKLVPSKLPWVIEARRAEALAEVARAEAVIAERLTVSEDFAALSPVPVAEAVAALQPDEALAVLHAGSNLVYGFVVRPGRDPVLFTSKVTLADLTQKVAQLRREASTFGAVDMANAAALYDLLLRPAEKALDGVGHLVVVGDGPLPGLPWAMLATGAAVSKAGASASAGTQRGATPIGDGETGGVDWASQPFLIRKFPVSLAPNIRSLVAQRSGLAVSKAPASFLGVGNPLLRGSVAAADVDVETLYKRDGGIDAARLADLAPLPETAAELRALASSLGAPETDLLLAANATETRLAERTLTHYRVLAFATHGILAGEVGGLAEPGLVLSPETGGTAGRDGYLSLSEIMSLRLDADLVILSACNTGGADGRPRAEWMSGLARGFIAAGARQMLVTLWSIPSDPTVRLTTGMTSAYSTDPSLGWPRALQKSVLAMMDRPATAADAHPASWASFTVLGVGSATR